MNDFRSSVGRTRAIEDALDPWRARALAAALDRPEQGADAPLPMLWHWIYFLAPTAQRDTAADGHAIRGDFMPSVPLPRRMFAGGRTDIVRPLQLGTPAIRRETITAVDPKSTAAGEAVFTTVSAIIEQNGRTCVTEEQTIVYLGSFKPAPPRLPAAIPDTSWRAVITPDDVLLFRVSALTYNGHRIHYDRRFATEIENYPDLVVHGPLTAMLLADLFRDQSGGSATTFSFRARAPLFCGRPIHLRGTPKDANAADLYAFDADGTLAMTATAASGDTVADGLRSGEQNAGQV